MMTFGDLIKDLNKSRDRNGEKVFRILRNEIGYRLLYASGILKDKKFNLESVGKWIDRKVPDNIRSYFPNGRINRSKVYRYFRRCLNKNNNWQIVQKNLSLRNDNGRFNCSNEDPEVFYQSLLDEFVESLAYHHRKNQTMTYQWLTKFLFYQQLPCPHLIMMKVKLYLKLKQQLSKYVEYSSKLFKTIAWKLLYDMTQRFLLMIIC
ncbi:hypothetical protein SPSIL_024370 [Sporomusa silvacetica DSM 10669]|uniref:Integrase SAM-like N-terminal domain-containing protein n=1 Tax=Sporomusa silvacetica DSM 10669 TaxID=1123289 RepID=A0ABZ3IKT0_9FIRM|nr:hypothetical protein SPSIL_53300 [Sporomusa silvacetica DSM 10669]